MMQKFLGSLDVTGVLTLQASAERQSEEAAAHRAEPLAAAEPSWNSWTLAIGLPYLDM